MDVEPLPASSRLTVILLLPHKDYPPSSQVCGPYVHARWLFPASGMAYVIYPEPLDEPIDRQHPVIVLPKPSPPLDGVPNVPQTDKLKLYAFTTHGLSNVRMKRLYDSDVKRRSYTPSFRG
ncbi:hypothetical protein BD626DRAFT_576195 [Schizophyllum amplum]|uniref:Uncharacterized protein n=1 Tax=Schizophyllum amplum TaxID=97359 RepID=A0A550BU08_9AGAR|nr:hypothetical protein BD626DRAFT_576195 [Auriculariopsis ampla]